MDGRVCARARCRNYADSSVTFNARERTVVVGPLLADTGAADTILCDVHAARVSVPRGWELLRPLETNQTREL